MYEYLRKPKEYIFIKIGNKLGGGGISVPSQINQINNSSLSLLARWHIIIMHSICNMCCLLSYKTTASLLTSYSCSASYIACFLYLPPTFAFISTIYTHYVLVHTTLTVKMRCVMDYGNVTLCP